MARYTNEFRATLLQIQDTSLEESLDRFDRGLKPNTRNRVEDAEPLTLEHAIRVAERYDTIHHRTQTMERSRWTPRNSPVDIQYEQWTST